MNEVYNVDCLDYMRSLPDGYFDLALCDPPYGRGEHGGRNRDTWAKQKNGSRIFVPGGDYANEHWDAHTPASSFFAELKRVSKHQIIFGVNYFTDEHFGAGRIIWDKVNDGTDQSDAEIAYNSLTSRVDIVRFMWRGMMQGKSISEGTVQQGNKQLNEKRIHPTQKPVALYTWLLTTYAKQGWKIFDPMLGSGSSRIAAYDLGFEFVGCEINKSYYDKQKSRFEEHSSQLNLFLEVKDGQAKL